MCMDKNHTARVHFGVSIGQISTSDRDSAQALADAINDAVNNITKRFGVMVKPISSNVQLISHKDRNPYVIITVQAEEVTSETYGERDCYECN